MDISKDILLEIYDRMVTTRFFSERINEFFIKGIMHGTTHLSVGEEASGVASCMALDKGDYTTSTHRGHSHAIGRGMEVIKIMAELFGKVTGCSKGKGGSMHLADFDKGHLGSNGVVGGGFAIATGAALTQKMKDTGKIVLCFFGDGASNEGSFHESLNMASVWKLPVIFFCENNLYGVSTPVSKSMNIKDVAVRAKSYGIPSYIIDGNDAVEVYKTTREAAKYCRSGQGPVIIEAKTYRYLGHSKSDECEYRCAEEVNRWKKKDPIIIFKNYLIENNIANQIEIKRIEDKALKEIDLAVEFAKNSPNPPLNALTEDVYA
ncbi:MAG TPA: thiamine pyrophosphate-dependent dehydrogenase E1 component subunit alpha [Eubacteriaceae bacterium]|nr:thiamine pyrophosphate-dependent dehydrogenase E1 component subunit alpha [Eubacteriaceae bacterium]